MQQASLNQRDLHPLSNRNSIGGRNTPNKSRPASRAESVTYLTKSARGELGPAVFTLPPAGIPGMQRNGVQRGAGENGQMRGEGKSCINFCPSGTSITHRLSHIHRQHNIKALGNVWQDRPEVMGITQWESFRLPETRVELLDSTRVDH